MKRQRFLTVTVGIMVLSVGLVLMTNSAQAAPPSLPNTSSWDKNLPSDTRFTTVFTGAVRDNNTGLVWEQAPDPTPTTWGDAIFSCLNKTTGGTKGWRLPSVIELTSLVNPANSNPALSTGHPFSNVQSINYWLATTLAESAAHAWYVEFFFGHADSAVKVNPPDSYAWCVRGA